jgi:hypothetical protein
MKRRKRQSTFALLSLGLCLPVFVAAVPALVGAVPAALAAEPATTQAARQPGVVRVKAGASEPYTDPSGVRWSADTGFADGDTVARDADMEIHNTKMPAFYRNEHFDMTSWSAKLPNGSYTVKLYFCETFDDVNAAGLRVFSFALPGHEVKNFDIFKEAGGFAKPITKTYENVQVTNGKLTITFTAITQSPAINGIEVVPSAK